MSSSPEKKKNKILGILTVFLMLLGLAFAAFCILRLSAYLKAFKKEPVYETVSLSEEAAAQAYVWLNQIEDMPLSYREIREMMGEISLTLVLTRGEKKGSWLRTLEEGSYENCRQQALDGIAAAYREVLRYRLSAADNGEEPAGELSDEALDRLMYEAYGVSVTEYLLSCEIPLLPTKEELSEWYVGEVTDE